MNQKNLIKYVQNAACTIISSKPVITVKENSDILFDWKVNEGNVEIIFTTKNAKDMNVDWGNVDPEFIELAAYGTLYVKEDACQIAAGHFQVKDCKKEKLIADIRMFIRAISRNND